MVCEVEVDGAAYKDGRLRKGDLILAVNDISFREVSYQDALRVLKEASSPLKLLVLRENPQTLFTTSQSKCFLFYFVFQTISSSLSEIITKTFSYKLLTDNHSL